MAGLGLSPHTYRELPVAAPYHTPAMAPVAEALADEAAGCTWRDPVIPVVTPTGPGEIRTGADARRTVAARRWPGAAWRECGPSVSLHRFVWKNGLTLDWDEA